MTAPAPKKHVSDFQTVRQLMADMGSPSFDPMPPSQHEWQIAKEEPPLYRIWSWLCAHTIHFGRRSPYAIDNERDNNELHLEHAAKDLSMDEANLRQYWALGKQRGLWRNGTKEEGRRRMYLCGKVTPVKLEGVEPENGEPKKVYTYPFDRLRPYLHEQVKALPPDQAQRFRDEYNARHLAQERSFADVVACHRIITDMDDDTQFLANGVKKIRETHKSAEPPEEAQERQQRMSSLLPHLERYVRTVESAVRTTKTSPYNDTVQTENAPVSLLPQNTTREEPERAGAAPSESAGSRRAEPPLSIDGKNHNQHPVAEQLVSAPRNRKPEPEAPSVAPEAPPVLYAPELEAERNLFREFGRMQEAFPHTDFSAELIKPADVNDQLLVHRVLHAVGAANVDDFISACWAKFKGLDKNALGKLPSRAPGTEHGPRSFGLILHWAKAYGQGLDESARATAEERARLRACEIQAIRQLLVDPNESPENKATLRAMLRAYEQQSVKGVTA